MVDLLLEAASRYQAEQQKVFKDFQKNLPEDVRREQGRRLDQLRAGHQHLAKALSILKKSSESGRSKTRSRSSVCSSSVGSTRSARTESGSVLSRQMQVAFAPASARRSSSELDVASSRQSSELVPSSARQSSESVASSKASQVSAAGMRRSQSDVSERLRPQFGYSERSYSDRWPSEISERRASQQQASEQRRSQTEFSEHRLARPEVRSSKHQWPEFYARYEEEDEDDEESQKFASWQGAIPLDAPDNSARLFRLWSESVNKGIPVDFSARRSQSPKPRRGTPFVGAMQDSVSRREGTPFAQGGIQQLPTASPVPASTSAPASASAGSGTRSASPWNISVMSDRRRARPMHLIPGWGHEMPEGPPGSEQPAGIGGLADLASAFGTPSAEDGLGSVKSARFSADGMGSVKSAGFSAEGMGSVKSARFSAEEVGRRAQPSRPRSAPAARRMSWQEFKQTAARASEGGVSVASTALPAGVYQGKARKGMPQQMLMWKRRQKEDLGEDKWPTHGRRHFEIEDHIDQQLHEDDDEQPTSRVRPDTFCPLVRAKKKFPFSGRSVMFGGFALDDACLKEDERWYRSDGEIVRAGLSTSQMNKRPSIGVHRDDDKTVTREFSQKPWYK